MYSYISNCFFYSNSDRDSTIPCSHSFLSFQVLKTRAKRKTKNSTNDRTQIFIHCPTLNQIRANKSISINNRLVPSFFFLLIFHFSSTQHGLSKTTLLVNHHYSSTFNYKFWQIFKSSLICDREQSNRAKNAQLCNAILLLLISRQHGATVGHECGHDLCQVHKSHRASMLCDITVFSSSCTRPFRPLNTLLDF